MYWPRELKQQMGSNACDAMLCCARYGTALQSLSCTTGYRTRALSWFLLMQVAADLPLKSEKTLSSPYQHHTMSDKIVRTCLRVRRHLEHSLESRPAPDHMAEPGR